MSNKITIKRSAVPGKIPLPGDLEFGEFAINYADGNLFFKDSSNSVATLASTQFVSVTGNVTAAGNISGNYFVGNGSQLTGITASAVAGGSNTQIQFNDNGAISGSANLTFDGSNVVATGNITGNYFVGNGAFLTGIVGGGGTPLVGTVDDFTGDGSTVAFTLSVTPSSENLTSVNISGVSQLKTAYSVTGTIITFSSAPAAGAAIEVTTLSGGGANVSGIENGTSNVAIPAANGNVTISVAGTDNVAVISANGVTVAGNITGSYILGNGSQLTGLPESYTNANVAAYLPTYTGNLASLTGNVTTTANISGAYFIGNGSQLTGLPEGYANANVETYLPTYTGNLASLQGNVTTTANVSASYVLGNGSALTSLTGANVTGQVPNALVSGTVYTAAQPNITSVGTLSSLSVSGNITGGNISTAGHAAAATLQTTGNAIIGGDLVVNGNTIQVNIDQLNVQDPIIGLGRGANNAPLTTNDGRDRGTEMWYYTDAEQSAFVGYQNSTGNIIAASNVSMANEIVTVNSYGNFVAGNVIGATVSATGNITGNYFIGNGSQLTGLPEGYGNADVAAYLPTYTGNLVSLQGNVTTTANVSGNFFIGNGSQLTSLTGANVTGQVPNALVSGTVTTAAQPNITSVGTLSSLSVSGNITGNTAVIPVITVNQLTSDDSSFVSVADGLDVQGEVLATGNITGNYFVGNGAFLTGIASGSGMLVGTVDDFTGDGSTVAFTLSVTPTSENVTSVNISGVSQLKTAYSIASNVITFSSAPAAGAAIEVTTLSGSVMSVGNIENGTSNVTIPVANGNVTISVAGTDNVAVISANGVTVAGNLLPSANVTYDLGSATYRWRDLYLSGNTINLGGATIKTDAASGAIALIPEPTESNPNPSGMVVSPSGGITVVATTGGEVSGNAIANAAASPTAAPVPIDITTTAPTNGQALIWDSANSEFVPGNVSAGGGGSAATVYGNIGSLPLANVTTGSMAFVSGNNRLYLWNGTGWFNIALINTNPTITGGADTIYTFATDGTPIVLTLTASDPEGIPLTWSYEVTSGALGNTATVSQADNVFTVTPSTDTADAGVFEITFSASDGVNIGTAASTFTLAFGVADPYYKQSVLVSTTATNNGTNNVFVDSSTNNFTVTRNGNATQGAYGPFSPAGWSGFFDGSGDYVNYTPSGSALTFGTGDFTVEFWVNFNDTSLRRDLIWWHDAAASQRGGIIWNISAGKLTYYIAPTVANAIDVTWTPVVGTWYHIALVRSSGVSQFYINGVAQSPTYSDSTNYSLVYGAFIGRDSGAASSYLNGYMSNVRIVKGTAIYTANFTPPVEPLTAVAGTGLLTLQSNRFVDNSTNNFAITRNGDTTITPFSPFDPASPYSVSANGGSAYFGATSAYALIPMNGEDSFGTGDFTVELWLYPQNSAVNLSMPSSSTNSWSILTFNNQLYWQENGSNLGGGGFGTITQNSWTHLAVCRSGSTIRWFVNGVLVNSASNSFNYSGAPTNRSIGPRDGGGVPAYVSNFRIVKGTAVYTAAFTPPTEPVTAIADTSLLMNFTNANIYDQTGKIDLETLGDAKTSTAVVKYGTTSMAFDGTGDYLLSPASTELDFGTRDFTIETWVNFTALSSNQVLLDRWATGNANAWQLYWRSTGTSIAFLTGSSTVLVQDPNGSNITTGTWYHIAVTRSGTTVRLFVNGTVVATATSSLSLTNTLPLGVGIQTSTATNPLNGYLSDVRITKGVARYTANFTPPTAQLGFNNPE